MQRVLNSCTLLASYDLCSETEVLAKPKVIKAWYAEVQPTVLNPVFDEECRKHVGEQYKAAGVKLQLNTSPTKIEKQADGKLTVTAEPKEGDSYQIDNVDVVLLATGRKPNTKNIGLEEVGLGQTRQQCATEEWLTLINRG